MSILFLHRSLAGISAQKNLSHNLIFKGGTCLKKCHLETYRLSEDLDYTVLDKKYIDEEFPVNSFEAVSDWIYENSDIEMPKNLISFEKYKNKKGIISVKGKIGFRGPLLQKKNFPNDSCLINQERRGLETPRHFLKCFTWPQIKVVLFRWSG